jgi:Fe-S cluster assembly ATP-binding protein
MKLIIKDLEAGYNSKRILNGIDLSLDKGKISVVMGPNGSGKSTLAQVLMGNQTYKILNPKSEIRIDNKNIINLSTDERARRGLFLAFQNPISIPGVSVASLLRTAYREIFVSAKEKNNTRHNPALNIMELNTRLVTISQKMGISQDLLRRGINDGFSGGEKKKIEMLQALILKPKFAVFDEIDTGLDVDALKLVATKINELKEQGTGVLIITHYQRILKYAPPDKVYILVSGKIVDCGDRGLAKEVEKNGYKKWIDK